MRRLSVLTFIFIIAVSTQAQTARITELAEQIDQAIGVMADRSGKDFFARTTNERNETDNLVVLQQSKITSGVLLILLKNKRPVSEMRDVADALDERFGRFDSDDKTKAEKQKIKKNIDDLLDELKKADKMPAKNPGKNIEPLGKLHWQGTVDDEVQLIIRGSVVKTKAISGKQYDDELFNFSAPMPNEALQVYVNKKDGRGIVKVLQLPSAENDWTAIVQILDKSGGAREYDLEISWAR